MQPQIVNEQKEREAGQRAAVALKTALRAKIGSTFKKRSGLLSKSTVSAKYREGRLDRLTIQSPHYSFKLHFGAAQKAKTPSFDREQHDVNSFSRVVSGKNQTVKAHKRKNSKISAHAKGVKYKAYNHIADAIKSSNALEVLATELSENRAVKISSQINF